MNKEKLCEAKVELIGALNKIWDLIEAENSLVEQLQKVLSSLEEIHE